MSNSLLSSITMSWTLLGKLLDKMLITLWQIQESCTWKYFGRGGDQSFADTKVVVLGKALEEVVITVLEEERVSVQITVVLVCTTVSWTLLGEFLENVLITLLQIQGFCIL